VGISKYFSSFYETRALKAHSASGVKTFAAQDQCGWTFQNCGCKVDNIRDSNHVLSITDA